MRRFTLHSLLALCLATGAVGAHAAEDCGFLPTEMVEEAFAKFVPWRTLVGGAVGHCSFASNARAAPNIISFMQQFKPSKAEASTVYDEMRRALAGDYIQKEMKGLGDRAFRYDPKDSGQQGSRTSIIVTQKDKLVMTVTLSLQAAVTEDDLRAAAQLGQFALRGANDPETLRKASTCPWFDEGGLKRLFGGKAYEVQVHGENSCMATDKQSRVLLLSALKARGTEMQDTLHAGDCQIRSVPELASDAKLSYACKGGNPRAATGFAVNGTVIQLTWAPAGVEPSEADRAALVELAKSARALQAAR
ncbi:hypothetical protein [Ottowia thiooxydans]|uniref:hypothetical protein n=1 Tax=Ottowia thiooxydans TaxID=219182 RepID=UPI00040BA6E8|nr:hypothetical protein [Ottowia thiooxydans]